MGIYINKGNDGFRSALNGEYVDKSNLIDIVNKTLFTEQRFSCVSRSRRFGKTMAAKMLAAYYDHSCDSRHLFADLKIAQNSSFEKHLNKYPVLYIDITDFTSRNIATSEIVDMLQREVKAEVMGVFPDILTDDDDDLMAVLAKIAMHYEVRFIVIIDEWDAICREAIGDNVSMDRYVNFLRRMFKGSATMQTFAGVYLTGILPIKKYKTQSALNNFTEYSMLKPGAMAPFFGFTEDDVCVLTEEHGMDVEEMKKWYDGYNIGAEQHIFNPNSVMTAIREKWCESYWARTGAFDAVAEYINMDYEGLKDNIIEMLAGGRCVVDPMGFNNDISDIRSRDDVLTVLIHLGYLTYDRRTQECFIPNMEVAGEMENAIKANRWSGIVDALKQSRNLLAATLRGDSEFVARVLDSAHSEYTSILSYNDENSLACVISLVYYYARKDYHIHREFPMGCGYADMVMIPRRHVSSPAMIVELKYNRNTRAAISQIKSKHYPQRIAEYTGDILLVGVNYDRETKRQSCTIEHWRKDN